MAKLFAIVSPAYTEVGDGFYDLLSYVVKPTHDLLFEKVCGYSLGYDVVFFDKIDDAKVEMENRVKSSKTESKAATQKAIVELEINEESKITQICSLHTVVAEKLFEKTEKENFFKPVRTSVWQSRAINKNEVTSGALDELNHQYQASKSLKLT